MLNSFQLFHRHKGSSSSPGPTFTDEYAMHNICPGPTLRAKTGSRLCSEAKSRGGTSPRTTRVRAIATTCALSGLHLKFDRTPFLQTWCFVQKGRSRSSTNQTRLTRMFALALSLFLRLCWTTGRSRHVCISSVPTRCFGQSRVKNISVSLLGRSISKEEEAGRARKSFHKFFRHVWRVHGGRVIKDLCTHNVFCFFIVVFSQVVPQIVQRHG